jgi:hypothetical protein
MRYSLLTSGVIGGMCLAVVTIAAPAWSAQTYARNSQIALSSKTNPSQITTVPPGKQVVCSATNPLAGKVDGDKLAREGVPANLKLAANILDIFCRDVRINTIVVRHYCTVLK